MVAFVLTLVPLLYAWVRIRPMDDSEPDTVLGMDAKRLALVTVSLALGAVVFVILGSAASCNPPTTESAIAIGSRTMVGTRRCPSTPSTLPRHGSCPCSSFPSACVRRWSAFTSSKLRESGGEPLWAPVHRRLVVVVHHRECGLLEPVGGVDDEELRQWT